MHCAFVTVGLLAHHQRSPNTYTPHGLYLKLHFPSCSLITPSPVLNNMDTIEAILTQHAGLSIVRFICIQY